MKLSDSTLRTAKRRLTLRLENLRGKIADLKARGLPAQLLEAQHARARAALQHLQHRDS